MFIDNPFDYLDADKVKVLINKLINEEGEENEISK